MRLQLSVRLNPAHAAIYKFQMYEFMFEWPESDCALSARS